MDKRHNILSVATGIEYCSFPYSILLGFSEGHVGGLESESIMALYVLDIGTLFLPN